jgi:hypothetical protein
LKRRHVVAIGYGAIGAAYAAYCLSVGSTLTQAAIAVVAWPIEAINFVLVMVLCIWGGLTCL